jgi:hypothetical protein
MKSRALMKKKGCLVCSVALFAGAYAVLWAIMPATQVIQIPLAEFSGGRVSAAFVCLAAEYPCFQVLFNDEAYVPKSSGTVNVYEGERLLASADIARFITESGFRGKQMRGKKLYRILHTDEGVLSHKFRRGGEYRAELEFSPPLPRATLFLTGADFRTGLERFLEKHSGRDRMRERETK